MSADHCRCPWCSNMPRTQMGLLVMVGAACFLAPIGYAFACATLGEETDHSRIVLLEKRLAAAMEALGVEEAK